MTRGPASRSHAADDQTLNACAGFRVFLCAVRPHAECGVLTAYRFIEAP